MASPKRAVQSTLLALFTASLLSTAPVMADQPGPGEEDPGFFAMAGDLIVARPVMLATTIIGSAIFIVSSPFSAMGGNVKQAGKTLVAEPFHATFSRCLGCAFPKDGY